MGRPALGEVVKTFIEYGLERGHLSMKITAFDVVKQLDGLSIEEAQRVLESAKRLLTSTQVVSAGSPLLTDLQAKFLSLEQRDLPE